MADLPRWQLPQPKAPNDAQPARYDLRLIKPIIGPAPKEVVERIHQMTGYAARPSSSEMDQMGALNWLRMKAAAGASILDHAGHNDEGDAARHAEWAAKMTGAMGRTGAKAYGDAHEREDGDQPVGERLMDLINNHNGRVLRQKLPNIKAKDLAEWGLPAVFCKRRRSI